MAGSSPKKRPSRRRPKTVPGASAKGVEVSAPAGEGRGHAGQTKLRQDDIEASRRSDNSLAREDNQPRITRRRLLLVGGGGIASGVFAAVVSELVDQLTSSNQAVRDDRAIEEARHEEAERKAPISLKAYYYDLSDDARIWVAAGPLTPDRRRQLGRSTLWENGGAEDGVRAVLGISEEHPYRLLTRVRIEAVGQWTDPVFVRQIRARVLRRSAPLSYAYLFEQSQGGEELLKIGFDLDESDSIARVIGPDKRLGRAFVDDKALILEPGEPLVIDVQAQTDQSYCEWVVDFELGELNGEKRVVTVDDNGRPFRSTSLAGHYQDRYYIEYPTGKLVYDGAGPFVAKL